MYTEFWQENLERAIWKTKPKMGDNITVGLKEIGCINVDCTTDA
jgi:hypothetical protein